MCMGLLRLSDIQGLSSQDSPRPYMSPEINSAFFSRMAAQCLLSHKPHWLLSGSRSHSPLVKILFPAELLDLLTRLLDHN